MTDSLEDYWEDLRQGFGKPKRAYPGLIEPACLAQLTSWAKYPNRAFQIVPGDDRQAAVDHLVKQVDEDVIVKWPCAWGEQAVTQALTSLVRNTVIHPTRRGRSSFVYPLPFVPENKDGWDLLWGVIGKTSFVIEEPLKGLIEKRFSRLSDMFRLLTEARFAAREADLDTVEQAVLAIGRWLEGNPKLDPFLQDASVRRPLHEEEALGVLFFLLTLANQNGLLPITIFVLDGLEKVDRRDAADLHHTLATLERWVPIGCPFRLLITWDGENKTALRRLNPKLAKQVRDGLAWIR
jgi:hypothetical protein